MTAIKIRWRIAPIKGKASGLFNPYFDQVRTKHDAWDCNTYRLRRSLVNKFAWAIPTTDAVQAIASFVPQSKVLSIGAGTGYWEYLMAQIGLQVTAFDDKSWDQKFRRWEWYSVRRATHREARKLKYQNHALFLCWPYMDNMAYHALRLFKGTRLIYIGEGRGGCTANDKFFDLLEQAWTLVDRISIPQWSGIHDDLYLYEKGQTP